jgi:hypothetical protein
MTNFFNILPLLSFVFFFPFYLQLSNDLDCILSLIYAFLTNLDNNFFSQITSFTIHFINFAIILFNLLTIITIIFYIFKITPLTSNDHLVPILVLISFTAWRRNLPLPSDKFCRIFPSFLYCGFGATIFLIIKFFFLQSNRFYFSHLKIIFCIFMTLDSNDFNCFIDIVISCNPW